MHLCALFISIFTIFSTATASPKIHLRKIVNSDIEKIVKYYSEDPVFENDYDWPKETFGDLLKSTLERQDQATFSILEEERSDKVIGFVRFRELDTCTPYLLYSLDKEYWNKGIMTDAIKKALDIVLQGPDKTGSYAKVFPRNASSARVLEKAGFVYHSTIPYTEAAIPTNEAAPISLYRFYK